MSVDVLKLQLYEILGVHEDATEKEITKAYRKQALRCHPDKNPDNPKAAELFHKLSKAFEVLTDAAARAAYDKAQKAKKAAEARHRELDSKRKKLKEDLEARENAAQTRKETEVVYNKNLQAEIERLRKEGSKLLQEEQERLKEEIRLGQDRLKTEDDGREETPPEEVTTPKLKIKWKAKKGDEENGGYSYSVLHDLLKKEPPWSGGSCVQLLRDIAVLKYGDVLNLIVSEKRKGSAIVEFRSWLEAKMALELEKGLVENPLSINWIGGPPNLTESTSQQGSSSQTFPVFTQETTESCSLSSQERDYESLVLTKLRQAEERKRLIEQMQKEDEES